MTGIHTLKIMADIARKRHLDAVETYSLGSQERFQLESMLTDCKSLAFLSTENT